MKIHVTGGRGFLGTHTIDRLNRRSGWEVETSDRADLDITDPGAVQTWFQRTRPDAVIHLAALCGAAPSRDDPSEFFRVNAYGTVNVLEACRRAGVARFVLASSLTVHGYGVEPMTEDSPYTPRHPYAASKVAAEQMTRHYAKQFGLHCLIVRPTLVVGEGCREPHAIGDFVAKARAEQPIVLHGSGNHRRDFIHPHDVAQALEACLDRTPASGTCEVFNLSNGEAATMRELAETTIQRIGSGSIVYGPPTNQTFSLRTRIDRARLLLNFEPIYSNARIIDEMISTLKELKTHAGTTHDDCCHDHQRPHAAAGLCR